MGCFVLIACETKTFHIQQMYQNFDIRCAMSALCIRSLVKNSCAHILHVV